MDIREIEPGYAVAPQPTPEDMPRLAELGFATVICNRPDREVAPELASATFRAAAEAAGIAFEMNAIETGGVSFAQADRQARILADAPGPVLAYCASGTRSAALWALAQTEDRTTDEILAAVEAAGYRLDVLRAQIETRRTRP